MKDLILIPTYNEAQTITEILKRIYRIVPNIEVLVIDDNSPDGTAEIVEKLRETNPKINILRRAKKAGLGAAYKDAFLRMKNDPTIRSFITLDADGSHDPASIPLMLEKISTYNLVIGSRYVKGGATRNWPWRRHVLSYWGNVYARIMTGLRVHDLTAGYICIQREFIEQIDFTKISATGYAYQIEFKYTCIRRLCASWTEIPITFTERTVGYSKITKKIVLEGITTPLKLLLGKR